jgi:hypothetical protein
MHAWWGKIVWRLRRRAIGEIGRRPHDGHAHVRADAHRDHVLGHLLSKANARVVPLGHDIGQGWVDRKLYPDVRIVRQQPRQGGPKDRLGCVTRRDPDGARRLLAELRWWLEWRLSKASA